MARSHRSAAVMNETIALWPVAASAYAARLDRLVLAFTALVLVLALSLIAALVLFLVRYRRTRQVERRHAPNRNVWLEVSWSLVPFLALLGFYGWSLDLYALQARPPADAMQIAVTAKQWMWEVQYPEGQREINALHVPAGRAVQLSMISQDVIHSFFVPALRLKHDVVPGRNNPLWFVADKVGIYRFACTQFCGADHSLMIGRVEVMAPRDYTAWLSTASVDTTLAARGSVLFRNLGCSGCHGPASRVKAPRLEGIAGRPTPLSDGTTVVADDQYIRDSILFPQKQLAIGYPPIMPTFRNLVSEGDLVALVAYVKSLAPDDRRNP
jgi:cytochrome c oxidase subunit 2